MPNILTLRREAQTSRALFRAIAEHRVSNEASAEDQHTYWRVHDTAQAAYARLDWRYQKAWLRTALVLFVSLSLASFVVNVVPLALLAGCLLGYRFYVVLKRLAPGTED